MERTIESFTLPISLWVVWCSPRLLYVVEGAVFFDDFSLKGSTMIWMESLGRAIAKVSAFWSSVGMARVNLMKISVSANTFSPLSVAGSSSVSLLHAFLANSTTVAQLAPSFLALSVQNHCGLPSGLHSTWHLVLPDTALGGHHCCALSYITHCLPLQCRPGSSYFRSPHLGFLPSSR